MSGRGVVSWRARMSNACAREGTWGELPERSTHVCPLLYRQLNSDDATKKKAAQPMPSKKKPASDPAAKPSREELLNVLSEALQQRDRQYQEFVKSIQSLGPLEKATEWLRYVARNPTDFGDQEALVYLRSRGEPCEAEIDAVTRHWRESEAAVIRDAARGIPSIDVVSGKVKHVGKEKVNPSQIASVSPFVVRDFWSGTDYQEYTIDATMLRTVEWCDIGVVGAFRQGV
jgi:hypothetical protein